MTEVILEQVKSKYKGEVAKSYEKYRKNSKHWKREQQIVELLLDDAGMGPESLVLDVPVGTGRFFPFYKDRGYKVIGVDTSSDMLSEADRKAGDLHFEDVDLFNGDITDLQLTDNSVDLSVCIRLMNWLEFPSFQRALSELKRVSTRYIIVGVRMSTKQKRIDLSSWLKQVYRKGKESLKSIAGQAYQTLRRHSFDDELSEHSSPDPPLIDHPEDAVRREFQKQGLATVREEQPVLFTSDSPLSSFGAVEELPYRIFLLRV